MELNQTYNWGGYHPPGEISRIRQDSKNPKFATQHPKSLCATKRILFVEQQAWGSRQVSCIAALWPIPVTLVESLVKTFTTSLCRIDLFSLSALKRAWNLLKRCCPRGHGLWQLKNFISSEDGSYDLRASKTGVTQIDIDKRCVIWWMMPNWIRDDPQTSTDNRFPLVLCCWIDCVIHLIASIFGNSL